MKRLLSIEALFTKHFVLVTAVLALVAFSAIRFVLTHHYATVDDLSKLADIVIKVVAMLVGAMWALNRYFTGRVDAPQIRVDATVDSVRSSAFNNHSTHGLLVYRLDVVNTGKTLIPKYEQMLEIEAVTPGKDKPASNVLLRWPETGLHSGGLIEPGSWAALNAEIPLPDDVKVVRFYLEIHVKGEPFWTWHRTFVLEEHVQPESGVRVAV